MLLLDWLPRPPRMEPISLEFHMADFPPKNRLWKFGVFQFPLVDSPLGKNGCRKTEYMVQFPSSFLYNSLCWDIPKWKLAVFVVTICCYIIGFILDCFQAKGGGWGTTILQNRFQQILVTEEVLLPKKYNTVLLVTFITFWYAFASILRFAN